MSNANIEQVVAGMGDPSNIRQQNPVRSGEVIAIASARARRRTKNASRILQVVAISSAIGISAPLAANYFHHGVGSIMGAPVAPAAQVVGLSQGPIPICTGGNRAGRKVTCLVDGDTGWEHGVKWRLLNIDTPEISSPGCSSEHSTAIAARDRLQTLMSAGYKINWTGTKGSYRRALVRITPSDGRDAGRVLLKEGLAQHASSLAAGSFVGFGIL